MPEIQKKGASVTTLRVQFWTTRRMVVTGRMAVTGRMVAESSPGLECRTQTIKAHNSIHQILECPLYKTNTYITLGRKRGLNPIEEKEKQTLEAER